MSPYCSIPHHPSSLLISVYWSSEQSASHPGGARGCQANGAAHSSTACIEKNRGIMRNSDLGRHHHPAPMCAHPPQCTWEPDNESWPLAINPGNPPKNMFCLQQRPFSHVQPRPVAFGSLGFNACGAASRDTGITTGAEPNAE